MIDLKTEHEEWYLSMTEQEKETCLGIHDTPKYGFVDVLTIPRWDDKAKALTCIAKVMGMLVIMKVNVYPK